MDFEADVLVAALRSSVRLECLDIRQCRYTGTFITTNQLRVTAPLVRTLTVDFDPSHDDHPPHSLIGPALEVMTISNAIISFPTFLSSSKPNANLTELSIGQLNLREVDELFIVSCLRSCPHLKDLQIWLIDDDGEGRTLNALFRLLTWSPRNELCPKLSVLSLESVNLKTTLDPARDAFLGMLASRSEAAASRSEAASGLSEVASGASTRSQGQWPD